MTNYAERYGLQARESRSDTTFWYRDEIGVQYLRRVGVRFFSNYSCTDRWIAVCTRFHVEEVAPTPIVSAICAHLPAPRTRIGQLVVLTSKVTPFYAQDHNSWPNDHLVRAADKIYSQLPPSHSLLL